MQGMPFLICSVQSLPNRSIRVGHLHPGVWFLLMFRMHAYHRHVVLHAAMGVGCIHPCLVLFVPVAATAGAKQTQQSYT